MAQETSFFTLTGIAHVCRHVVCGIPVKNTGRKHEHLVKIFRIKALMSVHQNKQINIDLLSSAHSVQYLPQKDGIGHAYSSKINNIVHSMCVHIIFIVSLIIKKKNLNNMTINVFVRKSYWKAAFLECLD